MQYKGCCRIDVDAELINKAKASIKKEEIELEKRVKIFSLLGNSVRLKIVALLLEFNRLCVCDLADVLEMKQSPISQHLRKLKDASLLSNEREGMTIFYFISNDMVEELRAIIKG